VASGGAWSSKGRSACLVWARETSYGKSIIQFIHQSAEDFLLKEGLLALDSSLVSTKDFFLEKGLPALDISSLVSTDLAVGSHSTDCPGPACAT